MLSHFWYYSVYYYFFSLNVILKSKIYKFEDKSNFGKDIFFAVELYILSIMTFALEQYQFVYGSFSAQGIWINVFLYIA